MNIAIVGTGCVGWFRACFAEMGSTFLRGY